MHRQHGICACKTAFLQPLLSVERKTLRVEKSDHSIPVHQTI